MLLRQVQVLLAVLYEGSFTMAAERLDMTQPAVSQTVTALEKSLRLRLLHRSRTGVQLTPDGERLLPHLEKLALTAKQLREEAARPSGAIFGKVRIGSFPSTSIHILPQVIRAVAERHPQLDVLIFEGLPHEIARWLEQGTIDLGFLESPFPATCACQPVLADEYLLLVPAAHHLAIHKQVPLRRLSGEPFILSKFGCEPVLREAFQEIGATMNVTYEVRDLATLFAMVREGLGVSMVPELLMTQVPADLVAISVTPTLKREIGLASPHGALLSLPVQTLRDAILQRTPA